MVDLKYSFPFYPPFPPCPLWGTTLPRPFFSRSPISPSSRGHRASSSVPHRGGFYSHYFLIPKAKDCLRPILDLREFNKHLKRIKFCMVTLASIIPSLEQWNWYAALDLKDAYFPVAICPDHHKIPRFIANRTQYQFTVLPPGLSATHRVFTKCMA